MISGCREPGAWTPARLGAFFPTSHNLLYQGQHYTTGFTGLTADPHLGDAPATRFTLRSGSPAIDAGRVDPGYHQDNIADARPDLGALEYGETIDDWRKRFGRCGPRWITPANAAELAPHRPAWPAELDSRWGGLDK